MNWPGIIAIIIAFALLIFLYIRYGRECTKVIIYILLIPLWTYLIFSYNDIRITILFGAILAFDIFYIWFCGKEEGWWGKKRKRKK